MTLPLPIRSLLLQLYRDVEDWKCGKCPCGKRVSVDRGLIPRMMIGARKRVKSVRLIVVSKNPGHAFTKKKDGIDEAKWYRDALSEASSNGREAVLLFEAMVKLGEYCHLDPVSSGSGVYHKTLMQFLKKVLEEVLDVQSYNDVLDYVYFTELVKCSTKDERGRLCAELKCECFYSWLRRELEKFPRKVPIVALGGEVYEFLHKHRKELGKEIVYLPHPSLGYRKRGYGRAHRKLRRHLSYH